MDKKTFVKMLAIQYAEQVQRKSSEEIANSIANYEHVQHDDLRKAFLLRNKVTAMHKKIGLGLFGALCVAIGAFSIDGAVWTLAFGGGLYAVADKTFDVLDKKFSDEHPFNILSNDMMEKLESFNNHQFKEYRTEYSLYPLDGLETAFKELCQKLGVQYDNALQDMLIANLSATQIEQIPNMPIWKQMHDRLRHMFLSRTENYEIKNWCKNIFNQLASTLLANHLNKEVLALNVSIYDLEYKQENNDIPQVIYLADDEAKLYYTPLALQQLAEHGCNLKQINMSLSAIHKIRQANPRTVLPSASLTTQNLAVQLSNYERQINQICMIRNEQSINHTNYDVDGHRVTNVGDGGIIRASYDSVNGSQLSLIKTEELRHELKEGQTLVMKTQLNNN